MELQALKAAHRHCSHHREEIGRSTSVGCFYCLGGYPAAAIVEWTDDGDTAICPTCGIDSVIGDASGLPIGDIAFLEAMNRVWFADSGVMVGGRRMASRYWFARQFPLTEVGANRMAPINSMGWMVVTFFAGCLLAGAAGLILFSFTYRAPFIGVVTLLGFGVVGTVTLLVTAFRKGDKNHTVEDYKSGRVQNT